MPESFRNPMGPLLLLLLYGLLAVSGVAMASRREVQSGLARVLMVVTWGAAQLLFSIQFLSLLHALRGAPLLVANALLTAATVFALRSKAKSPWREWRFGPAGGTGRWLKQNPWPAALLAMSVGAIAVFSAVGYRVLSVGDTYHFAMPLFWRQHATVLPFPATNPRFVSVAFATEALSFPGVLFLHSFATFYLYAFLAKLLLLWLIIALARQLGAGRPAAVCAGAVLFGFLPMGTSAPDVLLSSLWFTASLYFLLEARRSSEGSPLLIGFSLLSVLLSFGSKNVVLLQAPCYALFFLAVLGRRLWTRDILLRTVPAWALIGLLSSTTLWSFVSNRLWFGDSRGPYAVHDTISEDFHPASIWTREVRGVVHSFIDPAWLPKSLRPPYAATMTGLVRVLGGRADLPEDDATYCFAGKVLEPGSGLGPLGVLVLLPGILLAAVGVRGKPVPDESDPAPSAAWPRRVYAAVALGSFVLCYLFLRTQGIGITRLMVSCLVVAAPLMAWAFGWRWARLLGGGALAVCLAWFAFGSALKLSVVSPSFRATWLGQKADRVMGAHVSEMEIRWSGEPPQMVPLREPYSIREYYEQLLARVPPHSVLGSLSSIGAEEHYNFGADLSNQVFCLRDSRSPHTPAPVPPEVRYIVAEDGDFSGLDLPALGFVPWFESRREGRVVLAAMKRGGG